MFLKSLFTGVVLAGLAGGVVYFGTGTNIAVADVKSAVSDIKAETSKMTENVSANVKNKINDIRTETGLIEGEAENSEVILPEMNSVPNGVSETNSTLAEGDKIQFDVVKTETEAPTLEAKINDKTLTQAQIIDAPKQKVVEITKPKNWFGRFFDNQKAQREAARDERARKLGIEREPSTSIAKAPQTAQRPNIFSRNTENTLAGSASMASQDVQDVYNTVLDQTATIEIVELKDRAYLSLIDYTIRHRAFDKSKSVVPKISQPELRDTARSNIAVGYARLGQRDNAFDVLKDVEIDALSDVLRLQVIEAMTAPDNRR